MVRVAGRQLRLGCLMVLQQFIGINTIMYYSATILQEAHVGTDSEVTWLAAPVAAAQLVGTLMGMALIDRLGRRTLVLASLVGWRSPSPPKARRLPSRGATARTMRRRRTAAAAADGDGDVGRRVRGVALAVARRHGDLPVSVWLRDERQCRGRSTRRSIRWACARRLGVATAINWLSNLLVAATFLTLQEAVTKAGAFWLYAGVAAGGAGWLAYAMPETKGKTLEQIEALFQ